MFDYFDKKFERMQAQKNKNIEPPAKKYKKPDGHDIKVYLTDIFVVELFLNEIAGIHSYLCGRALFE